MLGFYYGLSYIYCSMDYCKKKENIRKFLVMLEERSREARENPKMLIFLEDFDTTIFSQAGRS